MEKILHYSTGESRNARYGMANVVVVVVVVTLMVVVAHIHTFLRPSLECARKRAERGQNKRRKDGVTRPPLLIYQVYCHGRVRLVFIEWPLPSEYAIESMPAPLQYKVLQDDDVSAFSNTGRELVHGIFAERVIPAIDVKSCAISIDGLNALYEIVWRVGDGAVAPEDMAAHTVTCSLFSQLGNESVAPVGAVSNKKRRRADSEENIPVDPQSVATHLINVIWQAALEVRLKKEKATGSMSAVEFKDGLTAEAAPPTSPEVVRLVAVWTALADFVRHLAKPLGGLPLFERTAKLHLDLKLLQAAQMIDEKPIHALLVKKRTARYYLQTKFNLLAEESEGFSKVIVELQQASIGGSNRHVTAHRIKSLIGFFHLDPNRTCDLVLETLESRLGRGADMLAGIPPGLSALVYLLSIFREQSVCHILGKKFHSDEQNRRAGAEEEGMIAKEKQHSPINMALCRVAALLIASKRLIAADLLAHLEPSNAEIRDHRLSKNTRLLENAANLGIVRLSATREEREAEANKKFEEEMVQNAYDANFSLANQKFGILSGMYDLKAWQGAKDFLSILDQQGGDPMSDLNVIKHLTSMGNGLIDPLYHTLPPNICCSKLSLTPLAKSAAANCANALDGTLAGSDASESEKLFPMLEHATSFKSLGSEIGPVVLRLGENAGKDVFFYTKLCRMLRHAIQTEQVLEISAQRKWILAIIGRCMLPALCTSNQNVGLGAALWDLLLVIPYNMRYQMYAEWKVNLYTKRQSLIAAKAEAQHRTKTVMKGLAKENARQQGMKIAKLALSNPLVVFSTILNQLERFDNMIIPVVDSFRNLSPLSFDVLAFCVLDKLSSPRVKFKEDGTNVAKWLQSLSVFAGTLFRRYPSVEHRGILQFVLNALEEKSSVDLIFLKELVGSMSGATVLDDLSADQLQGRAGGQILIFESAMTKEMEGSVDKSKRYLSQSMMQPPIYGSGKPLALALLILMAQQLGAIAFEMESKELKLIGNLYDQCSIILSQLIEFLSLKYYAQPGSQRSDFLYISMLPTLSELLNKFELRPEIAFVMARPAFRLQRESEFGLTDLNMNDDSSKRLLEIWSPTNIMPTLSTYKSIDSKIFKHMSAEFYLMFWSLSLYDICFPGDKYTQEKQKIRKELQGWKETYPQDDSVTDKIRKKSDTLVAMEEEENVQRAHVVKVMNTLKTKPTSWYYASNVVDEVPLLENFLQHCLLPRLSQSPEDAFFCARFVYLLHCSNGNWPSLKYFDMIERCVPVMVHCSTEREANGIGLFLSETLKLTHSWSKRENYEAECAGKFASGGSTVSFENFEKLLAKWSKKKTKIFKSAVSCGDYMTTRNTLAVLSKIVNFYPGTKATMGIIDKAIDTLLNEEKRADLKTVAKQYRAKLVRRKKDDPNIDPNPTQRKPKVEKEYNFDDTDKMGDIGTSYTRYTEKREEWSCHRCKSSNFMDRISCRKCGRRRDDKANTEEKNMNPEAKVFTPKKEFGASSAVAKTSSDHETATGRINSSKSLVPPPKGAMPNEKRDFRRPVERPYNDRHNDTRERHNDRFNDRRRDRDRGRDWGRDRDRDRDHRDKNQQGHRGNSRSDAHLFSRAQGKASSNAETSTSSSRDSQNTPPPPPPPPPQSVDTVSNTSSSRGRGNGNEKGTDKPQHNRFADSMSTSRSPPRTYRGDHPPERDNIKRNSSERTRGKRQRSASPTPPNRRQTSRQRGMDRGGDNWRDGERNQARRSGAHGSDRGRVLHKTNISDTPFVDKTPGSFSTGSRDRSRKGGGNGRSNRGRIKRGVGRGRR